MRPIRHGLLAFALAAALGCASAVGPGAPGGPRGVAFLGQVRIPSGTELDGVRVGGLSGLAPAGDGRYLAVCDDKGKHGPPRYLTVRIELADGVLTRSGVRLEGWTALRGEDDRALAGDGADLEGIATAPDGSVWISSEGFAEGGLPPFVARFSPDGAWRARLELPAKLLPRRDGTWGVRNNLALESLDVTPDGRWLVTATENALVQDGPPAEHGASPARILLYDLGAGRWAGEYVYRVERVRRRALPGGFRTQGLVDLLALSERRFLALERAFVAGAGYAVRLYLVALDGADDVSALDRLDGAAPGEIRPVAKTLLLDLARLPVRLDNLEGMALGPTLPDGRRVLYLVSDDNFLAEQVNQFLALALPLGIGG